MRPSRRDPAAPSGQAPVGRAAASYVRPGPRRGTESPDRTGPSSHKDCYPTIPIERYARWTRPDGSPFDPWVRVHTQLGARIGPAIPHSLHITGTVAQWESWTRLRFPETGDYVFPAGLATVHIDRDHDLGEYWEPNIWIIHRSAEAQHADLTITLNQRPSTSADDSRNCRPSS